MATQKGKFGVFTCGSAKRARELHQVCFRRRQKEHPIITKLAVGFLMVVSALALLIGPLVFLAGIWMPVTTGFAAMSGAMGAFGISTVAALWPILAVIAGIIALIAIGWYLYENWDNIVQGLSETWASFKASFMETTNSIGQWFDAWIDGLFDSGQKIITTIVDGILSVKDKIADTISSIFEWVDKFLPHSDAEMGPLSRLTDSGMAIPETMATGIEASSDSLASAMESSFGKVPNYTPSLANTGIAQTSSSRTNAGSTFVDFRPTIQVSLQTTNVNSKEDLDSLSEKIAEILAEKLQHVMAGTGKIVLE